jgi:hypothetical protein
MKALFPATFALALLAGLVNAQDKPPKHFRFIPLGELPVWKERLENGIRIGQEPPPGSVPPKELSLLSGEETQIPFKAGLRSMTSVLTIPGETPRLKISKGPVGTGQDWLSTPIPSGQLSLGVLYRDPATMNWNNPKMKLLKDDSSSFPAGNIRFTNVSDVMVIIQIGDWNSRRPPSVYGIKPGQTSMKPLKVGKNPIRVGYAGPGNSRRWIWSNQIRLLEKQRVQGFFYKAQGENPRHPVLFHYLPEPLPRAAGS